MARHHGASNPAAAVPQGGANDLIATLPWHIGETLARYYHDAGNR